MKTLDKTSSDEINSTYQTLVALCKVSADLNPERSPVGTFSFFYLTHHFVVVDHHQLNIFGLGLDRGLANKPLGSPQPPRHLLLPHLVRSAFITITSSAFPLTVLCTVWRHKQAELQAVRHSFSCSVRCRRFGLNNLTEKRAVMLNVTKI